MPDSTISSLPAATPVTPNDLIPCVQGGVTKTFTAQQIMAAANTAGLQVADYASLRNVTTNVSSVYVTGYLVSATPSGIAGLFVRDDSDTTSSDNGGTVIVASNGKRWKRRYDNAVSLSWFGAKGDGVADDTAAFAAWVAYLNSFPLTARPISGFVPGGIYNISSQQTFTRPVSILAHQDAMINFSGTGYAFVLGPANIANFDVFTQGEYTIDGLRFMGGASATGGIYLSPNVIEPRLRNLTFQDYGTSSTVDIQGQVQNWDVIIENCRKLTYSSTTAVGNFINIKGRSAAGTADGGNSRVTIRDCWMTSYANQDMGYFAYVNAVESRIIGGGFQRSNGGMILGPGAHATLIDGVYAEISSATSPTYITVQSDGASTSPRNVKVKNGYINGHSEVIGSNARMIVAGDANATISGWTVDDMTISSFTAGQPLIVQNDVAGQTGNSYRGIKKFAPTDNAFVLRGTSTNSEKWASRDAAIGSWTPTLGGTATYTGQTGKWVQNGNEFMYSWDVQVNSLGTGNTSQLSGLTRTNGAATCAGSVGFFNSLATSVTSLLARVDGAANLVQFTGLTAAGTGVPGSLAVFANSARIIGSVTIMVDEPL